MHAVADDDGDDVDDAGVEINPAGGLKGKPSRILMMFTLGLLWQREPAFLMERGISVFNGRVFDP